MSNQIEYTESNEPAKHGKIEDGVLYTDPNGSSRHRFYIGVTVCGYGTTEAKPALVALATGSVYTYSSGVLPGSLVKAAPGSITITIE